MCAHAVSRKRGWGKLVAPIPPYRDGDVLASAAERKKEAKTIKTRINRWWLLVSNSLSRIDSIDLCKTWQTASGSFLACLRLIARPNRLHFNLLQFQI